MGQARYEIYQATSPSGKSYIGLTRMGLCKRWSAHVKRATATSRRHPLLDSIRKHTAGAFSLEVLDVVYGKPNAQTSEREWIARLRPALNLSPGGEADGEVGSTIFWDEMHADPEAKKVYLALLATGCRKRHETRPDLIAAMAAKALLWRAQNPREAYLATMRGRRMSAKARGVTPRDPRFAKDGRLWIPSKKVRAARRSFKIRKSMRAQWAERDQSARTTSISASVKKKWAQVEGRDARLAQLAEARKNIVHSDEVKERRREGIRRYWAAKRAEKLLTT